MSAVGVARTISWTAFFIALLLFGLTVKLTLEGAAETYLGSIGADIAIAASFLGFAGLGAVVTHRQPANPVGWVLSTVGLPMVATMLLVRYALNVMFVEAGALSPWIPWLMGWTWLPSIGLMATALPLLIPDGQLPSPRWRPFLRSIPFVLVGLVVLYALRPGPLESPFESINNPIWPSSAVDPFPWILGLSGILQLCMAAAGFAGLAARFRRSRGIERQQIKWFVYGVALTAIALSAGTFTQVAFGYEAARELTGAIVGLGFSSTLVGAAIAILRYRLYDIDVLIKRTLVYGVLSALLITTYAAAVVLLQTALRPFTAGSDLAVAASTLLVVALFLPIRRRVQDVVDRRFYRARYDAARTLDAFSARLRNDVELESVRADLIGVVADTVRPTHASLWLR